MPFFIILKALSSKLMKELCHNYTLLYLLFSSLLWCKLLKWMCGVARGKLEFIQMKFYSKLDLIGKFWFQSGIPSKATQIGVIYEDFKSLTMSSPSFSKSIKHAIIMQEKSGLMEKWPLDIKEEHKRTTEEWRSEFELCDALTMQKCDWALFMEHRQLLVNDSSQT